MNSDPRWADDPSPSWDETAARLGLRLDLYHTGLRLDTRWHPSGGILEVSQKLWPQVHPALQEPRLPYRWAWGVRPVGRKGQRCRVLARGNMNSALLEFSDGYRVVTSRNGLRRR